MMAFLLSEPAELFPFALFFQFFGFSVIALAQFFAVFDAVPDAAAGEGCQKQDKENYACFRLWRIKTKTETATMIMVTEV